MSDSGTADRALNMVRKLYGNGEMTTLEKSGFQKVIAVTSTAKVVATSYQAFSEDTIVTDTSAGDITITVPSGNDWSFTLRMPESLNSHQVLINGGSRFSPSVADFTGYTVQLYPIDNQTIGVQLLGYIYEGDA